MTKTRRRQWCSISNMILCSTGLKYMGESRERRLLVDIDIVTRYINGYTFACFNGHKYED